VAADGLLHGYTEFLKCVAVIMFTEVIHVIANGLQDVEMLVYFVWRYPDDTLIFVMCCS